MLSLKYCIQKYLRQRFWFKFVFIAVGDDFTSFTGQDSIPVEFDEGSTIASKSVTILIHDDQLDEFTECFTAEASLMKGPDCHSSSTLCIMDTRSVLYSFQQPNYTVYESTGRVILTLTSSRSIPSNYEVDVDTIYNGIGNASGEGECKI